MNSVNRHLLHMAFITMLLPVALAEGPPYSVSMSSHDSRSSAGEAARGFQALGYAPIAVDSNPETGAARVLFGRFERYVDALIYSRDMRTSGTAPDATVASVTPRPGLSHRTPAGPLSTIFTLEVTSAGELPIQDLTGNPAYEALEQEDVEGTDASYREMLEGELRRTSESDPLCGYIHTNLAILDLKMGENESAMAHALPVANGEIASAAAHRVMAMIRVAWLLHQIPDRMRAYQAYSEIERFSTSENVKLRCQVERAGLLMELARSEKGTLAEARALCDQILSAHADSPSGFQRNRLATAALMRAETFYYENDRQAALEALTHVADTYADRRRESSMALYFLAHTLRREGRAEEACEVLENLKNVSLEDGETFARQDLNAKAQRDLVWMLAERGEHTRASQELDRFLARAPSADELRELSERLGTAGDLRTKVDASLATTVSANR